MKCVRFHRRFAKDALMTDVTVSHKYDFKTFSALPLRLERGERGRPRVGLLGLQAAQEKE